MEVTVITTEEVKRGSGRPHGHRNKPKEDLLECPSSPLSIALSETEPSLVSAGKGNGPLV